MIPKANLKLNRYSWVNKVLSDLSNKHLISNQSLLYDIGSRDEVLKSYCNNENIDYRGFDIEPLNAQIRYWNIETPFPYPDPKADIITLLEVIEHLNNPWAGIKNISELLQINGILLLSTPNPSWSSSRIQFLFNGTLKCFKQSDLDLNHHVFTPWSHIIERLLIDNGFEIIDYVTLDGQTCLFDKNLRAVSFFQQTLYRVFKILIEFFDSSSKGMSYGLIAKKIK